MPFNHKYTSKDVLHTLCMEYFGVWKYSVKCFLFGNIVLGWRMFLWMDVSGTIKDTRNCPEKAMKISHFNPNQSAPSIYIMIELCYFSLDQ